MICPKCKTDTLAPFDQEGVEVDFCSKCFGVWLDKGELGDYHELSTDVPKYNEVKDSLRETECNCPTCQTEKLYEMKYTQEHNIMIDICKKCEGIWLDAGELGDLEKIATQLESLDQRLGNLSKGMKKKGFSSVADLFSNMFK